MAKRIFLCLAHMSEEGLEQKYVKEAFDNNWVVPLGPNVNGFEQDLKTFLNGGQEGGSKEVVALSSGTAAVHLALVACGVGPGDEVCVQSFTFCASSHPVTYLGAKPVFVDSEADSWNMDPAMLETAIRDRICRTGKKPKAIVAVALYGMPYDVEGLLQVAERYDIPLIEDAAEGLGSRYKGQALGTFGRYGVLSFNGNKMITTSGGGALVCPDRESWNTVMNYATQARESYPYYQHERIGYNYRMSNVCAGIGRGQMSVLQAHIEHHRHIAQLYERAFAGVPGITFHKGPDYAASGSNYWLSTITLAPELKVRGMENAYSQAPGCSGLNGGQNSGQNGGCASGAAAVGVAVGGVAGVVHAADALHTDCEPNANVEAMRVGLDLAGIEARPLWKPMHRQPVYAGAPAYLHEPCVCESIFRVGLCLPSGPMVTDADVEYIVSTILSLIER